MEILVVSLLIFAAIFWRRRRRATGAGAAELIAAAQKGDIDSVRALIGSRADVNEDAPVCGTALHAAAMFGYIDIVQTLIGANADLDARIRVGSRSLQVDVIQHKYYLNGYRGQLPLELAVEGLIKAGFDPCNATGATPLMVAREHPAVVGALIAAGADVNARAGQGETALMFFASGKQLESIRALLAAGADVNARDDSGRTVLMRAIQKDVIQVLLVAGADATARTASGLTVLTFGEWTVVQNREPEAVRLLVAAGADINARMNDGRTVLMHYITKPDVIPELLAAGADANATMPNGATALSLAREGAAQTKDPNSKDGFLQTIKLLEEAGQQ